MPRLLAVRSLSLARASQPGRPRHLSAGSGLVAAGRYLYVIADDELHLGVFPARGRAPGALVRFRAGRLPLRKKERKRRKPDYEAIVALPPFERFPAGALLVLGSGSRPSRRKGVLVALGADGAIASRPRIVDLAPLYRPIEREFDALNIEAAFVDGDRLALLQRGNKEDSRNARIRLALPPLLQALAADAPLPRSALLDITSFDLGTIAGVPLGFTDAAALPRGGFVFTAVAEDTGNSYADGACAGSAIGIVDRVGRVSALWRLKPALKVEGILVRSLRSGLRVMAVTDADDSSVAATLLQTKLSV
jgi:hypothetical protein